ncbi:MAG: gamma-glutamylcyclotransferase [Anaerotruncus sp.]|nr:gamma-glutamylcyclotransferase [Anaerotruncus sp.]
MQKTSLYLAYGSNLNLEQMRWRCPTAEVVGTAWLQDYALLFRGGDARSGRGAVATIEPKEDANLPVLIWEIRARDEQALDRYEGYPYFYHKEQMEVELAGKQVSVMAYVMNPGYSLGLPSESYYRTIAQGYRSAGFDLETLDAAVEESYQRSLVENFEDFSEEYEAEDMFGSLDFMHL